jgi:hypothetical protein
MPLGARRTFRLASVMAVALVLGYGSGMPMPYFAPVFAMLVTAAPAPPLGFKALRDLCVVIILTLGIGLLLTPLLVKYPASALLIVAAGLYISTIVSVGLRKGLVGGLLTWGFSMVPASALIDYSLAVNLIETMLFCVLFSIASQWIVYPFFPEDPGVAPAKPPPVGAADARWIALRCTLIALGPVIVAFINPSLYLPIIMKSVLLAQQVSTVGARTAGRELVYSTLFGGLIAVLFWFTLKICPSLWIYFLLMLLFGIYFGAKAYGIIATRRSGMFWPDVLITLLILLGPAIEDSANGKDVYQAFAVRLSLFVAVALYASAAMAALEWLRGRRGSAAGVAAQGAR